MNAAEPGSLAGPLTLNPEHESIVAEVDFELHRHAQFE